MMLLGSYVFALCEQTTNVLASLPLLPGAIRFRPDVYKSLVALRALLIRYLNAVRPSAGKLSADL